MSDFVVMPKGDWTAILDSLRESMHTSELIKSGDVPAHIIELAAAGIGAHFTTIASGTYTPTQTLTSPFSIDPGLGVEPNFFLIFADTFNNAESYGLMHFMVAVKMPIEKSTAMCGALCYGYGYSSITAVQSYTLKKEGASDYNAVSDRYVTNVFNGTQINVLAGGYNRLSAGCDYHWICGVMNDDN